MKSKQMEQNIIQIPESNNVKETVSERGRERVMGAYLFWVPLTPSKN